MAAASGAAGACALMSLVVGAAGAAGIAVWSAGAVWVAGAAMLGVAAVVVSVVVLVGLVWVWAMAAVPSAAVANSRSAFFISFSIIHDPPKRLSAERTAEQRSGCVGGTLAPNGCRGRFCSLTVRA
jgi:hypothetical protein